MNRIVNVLKIKCLRTVVSLNVKKRKNHLNRLKKEEKFVYDIAIKMTSDSNSFLDFNPDTSIFYVKNGLKIVTFSTNSIRFVDNEHSYSFYFDSYVMSGLIKVYYRHKNISINRLMNEITNNSASYLKNVSFELNKK